MTVITRRGIPSVAFQHADSLMYDHRFCLDGTDSSLLKQAQDDLTNLQAEVVKLNNKIAAGQRLLAIFGNLTDARGFGNIISKTKGTLGYLNVNGRPDDAKLFGYTSVNIYLDYKQDILDQMAAATARINQIQTVDVPRIQKQIAGLAQTDPEVIKAKADATKILLQTTQKVTAEKTWLWIGAGAVVLVITIGAIVWINKSE